MTTQTNNKPIETIRDGRLKAVIWKHEGKHGPFYVTEFVRTYKDEHGRYHDKHSFSSQELLQVQRLAWKAYNRELILREADYEAKKTR